jgi:hypothetical protein
MTTIIVLTLILLIPGLILLAIVLVAPMKFVVDSNLGIVQIGWNRCMNAKVCQEGQSWGLRLRLPFWSKRWGISELMKGRDTKKLKNREQRSGKKRSRSKLSWARIKRIIKQFKLREFKLILDTDDFMWNAYLTPVFEIISGMTRMRMRINFNGMKVVKIRAETRIINVLIASIF